MSRIRELVWIGAVAFLAACGGGGSTGGVAGLQGPEQVTIIGSNTGGSAVRLPRGAAAAGLTDYQAAETRFWVRDRSMEVLDEINNILGFLHQTNYWDASVVNTGPYLALVQDEDRGGDNRGDAGPAYEEWTIESIRESDAAPQVVKFWVKSELDDHGSGGARPPALIYGKLTVTAEPSIGNPLGVFSLQFKQLPATAPSTGTDTAFEGYLNSLARTDGQSEIEFYMGHGDPDATVSPGHFAMRQRVHVIGNPDNDTGRAYAEMKFVVNLGGSTQTESSEYNLQFNAGYVARRDIGGGTTDVLDRSNFDTFVYRYGLYDANTETFVRQNSGFPITKGAFHGWAGYYGIWLPPEATLTNGDTIVRPALRQGQADTNYQAVVVPGRLQKRTRNVLTFADLRDEEMSWFDPTAGNESMVAWDGTDLMRVAVRTGSEWVRETTPVAITSSFAPGQWVTFFSRARGMVNVVWPATLSGSTTVVTWASTTVNGSSAELATGNLTLEGYFRMLRADITSNQANYQNGESPYLPDATAPTVGNQTYVFDRDTLMLTLGGHPVRLADGVSVTQGPALFGLECGPLFPTALTALTEAPNQTPNYVWSTGPNEWNQLRTLKTSAGAFVQFDEPLRFSYAHSEVGSPFHGRTFLLEWDGGNLHGIPSAENRSDNRWYPLLNVPTGTVLTSSGASYKVKQLEGEQVMVAVADPNAVISAQGFDLGTSVTPPSAAGYTDPAIGSRPPVDRPPLFVGGMAQGN